MRGLVMVFSVMVAMVGAAVYGPTAAEALTWACTPVTQPNAGNGNIANLFVYNGGAATANVSTKWLTKTGTNLAGVAIPGGGGALYPGQTGANKVTVASAVTLQVSWTMPSTNATLDGDVVSTVRVSSDQPAVVGMQVAFGAGSMSVPCNVVD